MISLACAALAIAASRSRLAAVEFLFDRGCAPEMIAHVLTSVTPGQCLGAENTPRWLWAQRDWKWRISTGAENCILSEISNRLHSSRHCPISRQRARKRPVASLAWRKRRLGATAPGRPLSVLLLPTKFKAKFVCFFQAFAREWSVALIWLALHRTDAVDIA